MNNIPTAEEFRLNTFTGLKESQEVKHLYDDEDINDIMIEFTKMHVQNFSKENEISTNLVEEYLKLHVR